MKESITILQFDNKIPLSFSVIKFDNIFLHMHSMVQLIIVLEGEFQCNLGDKKYIAKANDIFIVNPRTYHSFDALNKTSTILSVLINQHEFALGDIDPDSIAFNLNSMEIIEHPKYESIKYLIYSIVRLNSMDNVNSIYTNRAISFSLFAQLMNDFSVNLEEADIKRTNYDTITKITAYINDHYSENLSLSSISKQFNYSIAYLSRLFKQSLDTNFIDYYDDLRVNNSLNDLLFSNKTIEEIALTHGFENSRSYFRAFTSIYKTYPSQYRKEFKKHSKNTILDSNELKKEAIEKILLLYEQASQRGNNPNHEITRDTEALVSVDYKNKTTNLHSPQTKLLQLEDYKLIMDVDIQKCLKNIQKDINFEYITLSNIFEKEIKIIKNNPNEFSFSFITFDRIVSYLKSVSLKPYIKLIYDSNQISDASFINLLDSFYNHLVNTYSKEETSSWLINLSFENLETSNKKQTQVYSTLFYNFYTKTKKEIKGIKIGSPSFTKDSILKSSVYRDFLDHCKSKFIDLSFISILYQDTKNKDTLLTKNKDELKEFINHLKKTNLYFENKMFFENINFSSSRCLLNDTLYSSSYLCKNLIENIKSISAYSKLGISDISNELLTNKEIFNGNNSFLTYNLLKKPSYYVYSMFSKLGNQLIKKSYNYMITSKENKIIILVNNYSHYSNLYAENEYYQISEQERYHCFPKSTNIKFSFEINNLPYKDCKIKTTTISKNNGSSFDKWLEIGAPKVMTNDEIEKLKILSEPSIYISNKIINESKLSVECNIAPLETKLIEITLTK